MRLPNQSCPPSAFSRYTTTMKHRGTPAALAAQLKALYQTHKSAVENAELEYGTEENSVMVLSEVLSIYTGDSASEIKIERIKDGTEVPDNFDIDTVVTVTETETLVTTSFYVR